MSSAKTAPNHNNSKPIDQQPNLRIPPQTNTTPQWTTQTVTSHPETIIQLPTTHCSKSTRSVFPKVEQSTRFIYQQAKPLTIKYPKINRPEIVPKQLYNQTMEVKTPNFQDIHLILTNPV